MTNHEMFNITKVLLIVVAFITLQAVNVWSATKPEKFIIYQSHDLSGPQAPNSVSYIPCNQDFHNWYNETKGGINGVQVDTVIKDNAGKVGIAISDYEYFRQLKPKPIIVLMDPSFVCEAIKERAYEDGIIEYCGGGASAAMFPVQYNVGFSPNYAASCAGALTWARKHWNGPTMKIGFLTWDNTYGRAILDDQLRKWIKEQEGMELVGEEVFMMKDVDVMTQAIRLRNKGVNWVYDNTLANGPVMVSKAFKDLGILSQDITDTKPGKVHRASNRFGSAEAAIRIGGGPGGLIDGIITSRHVASYAEEDNPGIRLITHYLEKNKRGKNIWNIPCIQIWAQLYFVYDRIEKVVDKYGWGGLTSKRLLPEILNARHFNSLGLASISYRPTAPLLETVKIYMVKNGVAVPVSDYVDLPNVNPVY